MFGDQNNPFGGVNPGGQEPIDLDKEALKQGARKAGRSIVTVVLALVALFILGQCFYTVDETQHAIRFRFDEIVAVNVNNLTEEEYAALQNDPGYQTVDLQYGAGLKFKMPFVDRVEWFDNRLITYDTMPREVITSDKKKMMLDNNAQWWIIDPVKFKISMKSINSANQRIEDLMYSKMNEKVGRTTAKDLISNKTYVAQMLAENADELNQVLAAYGIKVLDIQIKRTDLPEANNENIYNRMRTEREQMARQYRSEGKEEAQKIKSGADKEAAALRAQANAEAQRIRGKGDADVAAIYNEAYGADPDFYKFYKTLETYRALLPDSGAKIVISPDSEFAQFLFSSK